MNKQSSKKKILVLFLVVLSVFCVYASLTPNVLASEVTLKENCTSVMQSVLNLDLSKYTIISQESSLNLEQLGGVSMHGILFNLTSEKSNLRIFYSFVSENLQGIYVLENSGNPHLTKTPVVSNAIASAQTFLDSYQKYTSKQIFTDLELSLTDVVPDRNVTAVMDDKIMQILSYNDRTNFKWSYIANNAKAEYTKIITMGVRDGFLSFFIDNWDLYPVGNTIVNISQEEAVSIAVDVAKAHSWSVSVDASSLTAEKLNRNRVSYSALYLADSIGADKPRSKNALEIYPVWTVSLALDRMYGQLYGLQVDIWADSKEVRSIKELYTTITPLSSDFLRNATTNLSNQKQVNSNSAGDFLLWLLLPSAIIGSAVLLFVLKKNQQIVFNHKPRFLKLSVILLSILILSIVFLPLVESANASCGSIIWGSRSSDATSDYTWSWRKTDDEISRANSVTSYIHNNFLTPANGYTDYTNYGVDKNLILYQANWMKNNYDYVTIIDWDHGVGGAPGMAGYDMPTDEVHYMFEDDSGTCFGSASEYYSNPGAHTDYSHGVYDLDIYNVFPPAKVNFAFINTCMSADLYNFGQGFTATGNPIGMPFGFTHRIVASNPTGTQMSNLGYSNPDDFPQCYIGFCYGSLALDQHVPYDDPQAPYWSVWVTFFFYFALDFDNSVNDALDLASAYSWPGCEDFTESPLYTGFEAVWPMDKNGDGIIQNIVPETHPPDPADELVPYPGCFLRVYGNGRIHLRNFQPSDCLTQPDISGPTTGSEGITYQFNGRAIDSKGHTIQYRFDWGDGSGYSYSGGMSNGEWGSATHSWDRGIYNVRVQAKCSNGVWSSWSEYCTIAISQPTVSFYDRHIDYGTPMNLVVYIDGDGGHQMPYVSHISTTTTHDFEFAEVYGYIWLDHVVHYHGSTTTYYTPYLNDISVSDGDYFIAYYDTWG